MPKLELAPGDSVTVTLKDSDGEITVTFGEKVISVHTDLPDTQGRVGEIYAEHFGFVPDKLEQ